MGKATTATDSFFKSLKTPGEYPDSDSRGRGLALIVSPKSPPTKSWSFRYRNKAGRQRRMSLGRYPAVTLEMARSEVTKLWGQIEQGGDPAHERKIATRLKRAGVVDVPARSLKVSAIWERYLVAAAVGSHKHEGKPKRAATLATEADYWRAVVSDRFGKVSIDDIAREDVEKLISEVRNNAVGSARRKPGQVSVSAARQVFVVMRALVVFAMYEGTLKANPMEGLKPPKVQRRDDDSAPVELGAGQFLPLVDRQNIRQVWEALDRMEADSTYEIGRRTITALRLCAFTLCRRAEVAGAMAAEFDVEGAIWEVPAARTKGGRRNHVPLSAPAVALVRKAIDASESDFLFPSRRGENPIAPPALSHAWSRVCELAGVQNFTLHGWRHLGVTAMTAAGVPPFIGSVVLSHLVDDGSAAVTQRHYNKYSYLKERREALETWAEILTGIIEADNPAKT